VFPYNCLNRGLH